jgi:hypothetical protein
MLKVKTYGPITSFPYQGKCEGYKPYEGDVYPPGVKQRYSGRYLKVPAISFINNCAPRT